MPNRTPLARRSIQLRSGVALVGCATLLFAVLAGQSGAQAGFPRTITHKLGTTTISKTPQRVVALGSADADIALALGVAPVGIVKGSPSGNGLLPWQNAKLRGKRTTVLNADTSTPIEKVAALRPDLILAAGYFTIQKDYQTLKKIAPTIAFQRANYRDTYQEQTRLIGRALGREAAAARVLAGVERRIASTRRSHPKFRGKTLTLAFMSDSNTINVVTDPKDQTIRLLGQLGVGLSKSVRSLPKNGQGGVQGAVSLEQVGRLEASALVIAFASPALRRQLVSNRVFKNMSVVKRRAYSEMDLPTITGLRTPSVLSVPYGLNKIVAALNKTTR